MASVLMIHCIKNSFGELDKSMAIGPALWSCFDLIFIHSGHVQLKITDNAIELDPGQAVLLYPETPFRSCSITLPLKISVHHFNFEPDNPAILEPLVENKFGFKKYPQCDRTIVERDIERVVKLAHNPPSSTNSDIRNVLMTLIMCQLQTSVNTNDQKCSSPIPEIEKLTKWMEQNISANITLDDMANQIGLSTSHFRTVFASQIGKTPGSYFSNMRMNKAAQLLRETRTPIKNISMLLGYDNVSNFYRVFKSHYRTPPKLYRKEHSPLG
jgi:AraC-like DNA-binding protein